MTTKIVVDSNLHACRVREAADCRAPEASLAAVLLAWLFYLQRLFTLAIDQSPTPPTRYDFNTFSQYATVNHNLSHRRCAE